MPAKKINPRNIPRTQRDVDRALERGHAEGANFLSTMMLFILKDKHGFPDDEIERLAKEVDFYCGQLNDGAISFADVKNALKREYDVTVRFN